MKLREFLKKLWIPVRIIIKIASLILVLMGFRWMGLKGLFGMIAGMAIIILLISFRSTSAMVLYIIRLFKGEEDLYDYIKKGKTKEDEFIEVGDMPDNKGF